MIKNNIISDRNKEKILSKCIALIGRGYSIEFCEIKFKKYSNALQEYLPILKGLKKLRRDDLDDAFLKNTLHKIYADCDFQDEDVKNPGIIKIRNNRFHTILKPALIFVAVVAFFSSSFAGILFASQNSLPSNPLYPVKRYGENVKLLVTPESKKNILHYQMLNNRLNEATLFLKSPDKEKNKIIIMIKDTEEEFNQCKKYNYFGDYTEKEISDLIEKIKEESANEFYTEDKQENDLKETAPDSYDNNSGKDSADTGNYEEDDSYVYEQDSGEKEDTRDSGDNEEDNNYTEINDDKETGDYQETTDESELKDNQEKDDESIVSDDNKTDDDSNFDDNDEEDD